MKLQQQERLFWYIEHHGLLGNPWNIFCLLEFRTLWVLFEKLKILNLIFLLCHIFFSCFISFLFFIFYNSENSDFPWVLFEKCKISQPVAYFTFGYCQYCSLDLTKLKAASINYNWKYCKHLNKNLNIR